MKEMFNVVTLQEARKRIENCWVPRLTQERVPLTDAFERRLAASVISREDVPGFSRTTVDGFAVRAEDTFGAGETIPAYFELVGEVSMGAAAEMVLMQGQAARISTGGMLPESADAVVMIEDTEVMEEKTIAVTRPAAPGENIIKSGEDITGGKEILPTGMFLRPSEIGVLAALGVTEVNVEERLKVGIISTGNEVVNIAEIPGPGEVRDINTYSLLALAASSGAEAVSYGIIKDEEQSLLHALEHAASENHMVLLSGGSSVGTRDITLEVLEKLKDAELLFHGLALRPGKPTLAASRKNCLIFGLPGHPVSALVVAHLLLQPLWRWGSYPKVFPTLKARLSRNISSGTGREDYIRVALEQHNEEIIAKPVLGKSGMISNMAKAHGLLRIPLEQEGLEEGTIVDIMLV